MRRRALIAGVGLGVVALSIGLFMTCGYRERAVTRAEQRDGTSAPIVTGARSGVDRVTRNVAGTVFLDDAAVNGATVRLVEVHGTLHASRRTDATGRFDFGGVPVATYRVIAEVPRATGAAIDVDLRDQGVDADKLRLIAHACDASLHGVVRDASGGPIGRARVFVSAQQQEGPGADAGDDGAYDLCVPVGYNAVIVRADGYADAFWTVNISGRARRNFELVPEAVVAGRTVRASDGAAVAGAKLTLNAEDFSSLQRVSTMYAVSGADGEFRFRGVAAGRYWLSATADHLVSAELTNIDADVATPAERLEHKLVPAFSIAGQLVETGSRKPVPYRVLWAEQGFGPQHHTKTASDGSFLLEGLEPGDYRIAAARFDAQGESRVKLANADVKGVIVEVDPAASIAGRVTRGGRPVDGAAISAQFTEPNAWGLSASEATSDADGRFVLRDLRAGSYRIYAESKRLGAFTDGPIVTLREAEQKTHLELELDLAGSIAGTVVDHTGAPIAGARVRFSHIQRQDYGDATTTDDGTFKATALAGGGEYMFEVHPSDSSTLKLKPADGVPFAPIRVRDGSSHVTGVVIKVRFDRFLIRGRVVSSDGIGVADISVYASYNNGRRILGQPAITDVNGGFTIKDVPAGRYELHARSPLGNAEVDNVAAGATHVELRLPALGAIEGTLEGFAAAPAIYVMSIADSRQSYRAAVRDNKFALTRIPVGEYALTATTKDGVVNGSATVEAKTVAKVVLRHPGVGTIEGRVVDESTRLPSAGLMCSTSLAAVRSDKAGTFRLERVTAGTIQVVCHGPGVVAHTNASVEPGETTRVELTAQKVSRTIHSRGYAGLELELHTTGVAVKKTLAGGPAERAGIKSGDIIREIRHEEVDAMNGTAMVLSAIESGEPGDVVGLTLERDGTARKVELELAKRP